MRSFLLLRRAVALGVVSASLAAVASAAAIAAPPSRVVELVSARDASVPVTSAMLSASGDQAAYFVWGGTDESSTGDVAQLWAERTPSGWSSSSATPPRASFDSETVAAFAAAEDLKRFVLVSRRFQGASNQAPATFYRWDRERGRLTRGASVVAGNTIDTWALASDDAERVLYVFRPEPTDWTVPPLLYDMSGPTPVEIGTMPDGRSPRCGVDYADFVTVNATSAAQNWISSDGERVYFHSRGNTDCSGASNLYVHVGALGSTTRLISGPPIVGPDNGARFANASNDGSRVFFTTASRLAPDDRNATGDIYRYTDEAGSVCLTCVVPEANVTLGERAPANSPDTVLVAENGTRAYFTSTAALTGGAPDDGLEKLYVWRDRGTGEIAYVGPATILRTNSSLGSNTEASTDGSVLAFLASRPELDALTGSTSGGFAQYYRYDDADGSLQCMSCAAEPSLNLDVIPQPGLFGIERTSALTSDGRSFFFGTADPLVPEDVNAAPDLYEWRDGGRALITDGQSAENSDLRFRAASADGRDVLFTSTVARAPGGRDGLTQLYDARVGGGFPEPLPPVRCDGAACQGTQTSPPNIPTAATLNFSGSSSEEQEAPDARRPTSRVVIGRHVIRGARITLSIRAPEPGRLVVTGRAVARRQLQVARPGVHRVSVVLTRAARRTLRARGRVTARLRVTYTANGATPASKRVSITVKSS